MNIRGWILVVVILLCIIFAGVSYNRLASRLPTHHNRFGIGNWSISSLGSAAQADAPTRISQDHGRNSDNGRFRG